MQIVMTKQIHNGGGTIALDSGMRHKKRGRNRYRTVEGGGALDKWETDTERWWGAGGGDVGQWDETKKDSFPSEYKRRNVSQKTRN